MKHYAEQPAATRNAPMRTYYGARDLKATPMNLGKYNEYRGWTIPEDEDPEKEGYLVEYLDGGGPNHPDHQGYIAWSPKDVFEAHYRIAGTGRNGKPGVSADFLEKLIKEAETEEHVFWGKELQVSYRLPCGFTVTGRAACVCHGNFDIEYGRGIAFKDAIDQLWKLEGYLLQNGVGADT